MGSNRRLLYCFILLLWMVNEQAMAERSETTGLNYREKRQVNAMPLVFPLGGIFKLIIGLSSPVPNSDHINLSWAVNFQYQYLLISNITQLSPYYFIKEVTREQREADFNVIRDERFVLYQVFATLLDAKGIQGLECVLRAICEAAQYPVEEEGLVGEIIHLLLTPDYGKTPFDDKDPEWEQSMSQFRDAATAGRQMFSCPSIYSGCPEGQGVLELVTTLRDQ